MNLPPRQKQALDVVVNFMAWHQYPPTVQELADTMHVAHKTARQYLLGLDRNGAIKLMPGTARGIRVLRTGTQE